MLAKTWRLNRQEIAFLKDPNRKEKIVQGSFFGLVFQETNQSGKFGVIISNKISSRAVKRNRIKRLLYRAIGNKMADRTGLFLFLAKKPCLEASLESFEKELDGFMKKPPFLK